MTSHVFQERFVLLLRSAYDNGCHGLVKGRPAVVARSNARSRLPGARGIRPVSVLSLASTPRPRRAVDLGRAGPLGASETRLRTYATAKNPPPRNVAILGGGITGLTAAHYLVRHAKDVHITLYEGGGQLGGWINGESVALDASGGEDVLLQRGPRMLRSGATSTKYDDLVLYDVLASLKIADKIVYPKGAANSRYLYYPDHLVKLPSQELSLENIIHTIRSYFTEPLWNETITAGMAYAQKMQTAKNAREEREMETKIEAVRNSKPWARPPYDTSRFDDDESVASFLRDMMHTEEPVRNIVSGMLHGIYGGDVYELSAKHTIFQNLWLTLRSYPGDHMTWIAEKEVQLCLNLLASKNGRKIAELAETAVRNQLLAFDDGLLTLVRALEQDLQKRPNVTIRRNSPVTSLSHETEGVQVTSKGKTQRYDQVLSTIYSRQLAQIAQPANSLPSLAAIPSVTIMVVNLWYPDPYLLDANPGFGYLVPQSTPVEENPERLLGVLFDSDVQTREEVPGTKLTVMLGGHYWNDWHFVPNEENGIALAKSVLERHLGIPAGTQGVIASARLCRDCLPQHTVGHRKRVLQAHHELESAFQGKLMVAGPSYTTIGVMPAMRAGYDAGMRIASESPRQFRSRHPAMPGEGASVALDRNGEAMSAFLAFEKIDYCKEDHIGLTGLQWATKPESEAYVAVEKGSLLLKKSTKDSLRFRDADAGSNDN